jgi:hypothetical protein
VASVIRARTSTSAGVSAGFVLLICFSNGKAAAALGYGGLWAGDQVAELA